MTKEEKKKEFIEAVSLVKDYLYKHGDPYTTITVTQRSAEILRTEDIIKFKLID